MRSHEMRLSGSRSVVGRLSGVAVVALLVVATVGVGACQSEEDSAMTVLTVVGLPDEVQGWRLRAEAFSADLDGSPTFFFGESEQVTGTSMTSAENPLTPRSYVLKVELAEPSGETRTCEADLVVSAGESVELTLEAESLVESAESGVPPPCSLSAERSRSP